MASFEAGSCTSQTIRSFHVHFLSPGSHWGCWNCNIQKGENSFLHWECLKFSIRTVGKYSKSVNPAIQPIQHAQLLLLRILSLASMYIDYIGSIYNRFCLKGLRTASGERAWTKLRQTKENIGCIFLDVGFYLLGISEPSLVLFISSCSPKGTQSSLQQKCYYIHKPLHNKEGQESKQMLLRLVVDSLSSFVENASCKPQAKNLWSFLSLLRYLRKGREKLFSANMLQSWQICCSQLFSFLPASLV